MTRSKTAADSATAGKTDAKTGSVQRGGTAAEVAEAVMWLCSEQSSYCTGVILDIAGGRGL